MLPVPMGLGLGDYGVVNELYYPRVLPQKGNGLLLPQKVVAPKDAGGFIIYKYKL